MENHYSLRCGRIIVGGSDCELAGRRGGERESGDSNLLDEPFGYQFISLRNWMVRNGWIGGIGTARTPPGIWYPIDCYSAASADVVFRTVIIQKWGSRRILSEPDEIIFVSQWWRFVRAYDRNYKIAVKSDSVEDFIRIFHWIAVHLPRLLIPFVIFIRFDVSIVYVH